MARFPVHVVLRARSDAPGLRGREVFRSVQAGLAAGAARAGFRLVHFSVQGNHLHLVVEAVDKVALSRGMQGLAVRVARAVNRTADRTGRVFADHYLPGSSRRRRKCGGRFGTSSTTACCTAA